MADQSCFSQHLDQGVYLVWRHGLSERPAKLGGEPTDGRRDIQGDPQAGGRASQRMHTAVDQDHNAIWTPALEKLPTPSNSLNVHRCGGTTGLRPAVSWVETNAALD